ncbi:MAG: twin transmembrane helix small protein [Alphaproteobacteria bacterium]|nr:twin transmembrane helix small protein [Alphaproteobacteria bacterium]
MNTFLTVLLILAMVGTFGVMLFGMIGMGRSEEDPMRSNRMMRWRVILQAVALVLAVLLISMLKS